MPHCGSWDVSLLMHAFVVFSKSFEIYITDVEVIFSVVVQRNTSSIVLHL